MKRLLLLLVALLFTGSACTNNVEPYAARVNGKVIPADVVDRQVASIAANPEYAKVLEEELLQNVGGLRPGGANTVNAQYTASLVFDRILSVLIDERIAREGIEITPEARAATEASLNGSAAQGEPSIFASLDADYRNYVVDVQTKLSALLAQRDNPQTQRAVYDANPADYEQVCLRQIGVQTQAQAAAFKARAANGEDFGALAREALGAQQLTDRAGDPADPANPTCVILKGIGAAGRNILNSIPVGGVSEPIPNGGGFLLVNLVSRNQQPFEAVQSSISETLGNRTAFFEELLQGAEVEVNPRYGVLRRSDPNTQQSAGVYPLDPVALAPAGDGEASGSPLG